MTIYRVLEQETSKEIFELVIDTERELVKLQEQNKTLKEALELVIKESGSSTNYNKVAREALKKAEEV